MKAAFLTLALSIVYKFCFPQAFSIKEYLSKDCNDVACLQSFFESKRFGKKINWNKSSILYREDWILNETEVAGSANVVRGGFYFNDLFCLFGTNDKAAYDNLLEEAKQLGFRKDGYRNEEYGEAIFFKSDNYAIYYIGAGAVVKNTGNYKFKYWVSIRKSGILKDPKNELFTQIQKTAKPQKITNSARQFFYYEKFNSAETEARKSISANPQSAEDYYWLVLSQLALSKTKEANSTIEAGIKATANNPLLQVVKGHVLLSEKKNAEARRIFESVKNSGNQKNGPVLMAIARAISISKVSEAETDYGLKTIKEAVDAGVADAELLVTLGLLYKKKLDDGNAFMAYQNAAQIDPLFAKAYYQAGRMFQAMDNETVMLDYYNKAINSDQQYAPVYVALYHHYSFRDVNKAKEYLGLFLKYAEPNCENYFFEADYLFRVGKYNESLVKTLELEKGICKDNQRIKVLKAYNYNRLGDSLQAKNLMESFFSSVASETILSGDYKFAADLNARFKGAEPVAEMFYQKAIDTDTSKQEQLRAAQGCAVMFEKIKDHKKTAYWYQQVVNRKPNPTNVDLFKLGTAYYNSGEYSNSKKIFETYSQKYPNDWRGYLFQARSASIIDSAMTIFAAAPLYEKFIPLANADAANTAKTRVEACLYLFAYQYQYKKDKTAALDYLNKVLEIEPANANALKYRELLSKGSN